MTATTKERKTRAADLQWRAVRPMEMEATAPNGALLRIKQARGHGAEGKMFWYCYCDTRYLGVEHALPLAQARALCGRMKMPDADLGEWLQQHGAELPDDLLVAEKARYEAWKKNPKPRPELTQPVESPRSRAGGKTEARPALASAKSAKKTAKGERPTGRLNQEATVRVLRRDFTGKPGTKWRARQEHVFSLDGKRVRDVKDDDALKNMIRDEQVKLEEK